MTGQFGEASWAGQALVYGVAPAGATCCRGDLPILPDCPAVGVPGLDDGRAWQLPAIPRGAGAAISSPSGTDRRPDRRSPDDPQVPPSERMTEMKAHLVDFLPFEVADYLESKAFAASSMLVIGPAGSG